MEVVSTKIKNRYPPKIKKAVISAVRETLFRNVMLGGEPLKGQGMIIYYFDGNGGVQLYKFSK